ncbi:unnamed protein product [Polarella glacialis]|uniref:Uncharacterized protein n=1 Tax=Polarella glacialis TaxID=89957 RepID=A0A813K281_POLGL|nr:unnamed protein product [Polarella glacialis]
MAFGPKTPPRSQKRERKGPGFGREPRTVVAQDLWDKPAPCSHAFDLPDYLQELLSDEETVQVFFDDVPDDMAAKRTETDPMVTVDIGGEIRVVEFCSEVVVVEGERPDAKDEATVLVPKEAPAVPKVWLGGAQHQPQIPWVPDSNGGRPVARRLEMSRQITNSEGRTDRTEGKPGQPSGKLGQQIPRARMRGLKPVARTNPWLNGLTLAKASPAARDPISKALKNLTRKPSPRFDTVAQTSRDNESSTTQLGDQSATCSAEPSAEPMAPSTQVSFRRPFSMPMDSPSSTLSVSVDFSFESPRPSSKLLEWRDRRCPMPSPRFPTPSAETLKDSFFMTQGEGDIISSPSSFPGFSSSPVATLQPLSEHLDVAFEAADFCYTDYEAFNDVPMPFTRWTSPASPTHTLRSELVLDALPEDFPRMVSSPDPVVAPLRYKQHQDERIRDDHQSQKLPERQQHHEKRMKQDHQIADPPRHLRLGTLTFHQELQQRSHDFHFNLQLPQVRQQLQFQQECNFSEPAVMLATARPVAGGRSGTPSDMDRRRQLGQQTSPERRQEPEEPRATPALSYRVPKASDFAWLCDRPSSSCSRPATPFTDALRQEQDEPFAAVLAGLEQAPALRDVKRPASSGPARGRGGRPLLQSRPSCDPRLEGNKAFEAGELLGNSRAAATGKALPTSPAGNAPAAAPPCPHPYSVVRARALGTALLLRVHPGTTTARGLDEAEAAEFSALNRLMEARELSKAHLAVMHAVRRRKSEAWKQDAELDEEQEETHTSGLEVENWEQPYAISDHEQDEGMPIFRDAIDQQQPGDASSSHSGASEPQGRRLSIEKLETLIRRKSLDFTGPGETPSHWSQSRPSGCRTPCRPERTGGAPDSAASSDNLAEISEAPDSPLLPP